MDVTLKYRGFEGSIDPAESTEGFYGKVLHIRGLVSYTGRNIEELINDFKNGVDDYIADYGEELQKPDANISNPVAI